MSFQPAFRGLVSAVFAALLASVAWLDRSAGADVVKEGAEPLGFRMRETAREHGIDFTHRETALDPKLDGVAPHVSAMGAAVSVADFDGDGWSDLYATTSRFGERNALYRNEEGPSGRVFRDVAAAAGVADVSRAGEGASMGSVWGDFDNDGAEDLFVHKWGYQQLFRNRGDGTFEDVSERSGVRRWMNANAACWLDYDRDGALDLYVAGYFSEKFDLWRLEHTRILQESFEFATNGGRNVLFRNRGDGTFEDVTERTGCDSTRWTLAVASADLDRDGWPDLYLANDYGPEELFLNRGGRFERATGAGLEETSKSGMSVTLGDFENSGRFGVYVTNISAERFLFQGNNLRANRLERLRRMVNLGDTSSASSRAVVDCGWAWGAQFADFDNDGRLDLFVVNGFISASRERDFWYGMTKVAGAAGDLFQDARNWEPIGDASLSGYEVSRVLHNRAVERGPGLAPDVRFVDVAREVGVTDDLDGRAVAVADLFRRGALDAVVANQKGPLLLYENEVEPSRRWVQLHLKGTRSNRSAIGAEVTLEFGGRIQVQAVQGASGFCSQNERALHFGLGDAERVERATIRWPSGLVQELTELEPGRRHEIEEPR